VFQAGVANYQDTGTTATSSNTSDAGSLFRVYSGASVTIDLTVYSGANQTGASATQSITYTPPIDVPSYTVTWNGNGGTVGTEGSPWTFKMNNILQAQIKRAMFVEVIIQYVHIITLELILPLHLRQPALLAVLAKTTALQH